MRQPLENNNQEPQAWLKVKSLEQDQRESSEYQPEGVILYSPQYRSHKLQAVKVKGSKAHKI